MGMIAMVYCVKEVDNDITKGHVDADGDGDGNSDGDGDGAVLPRYYHPSSSTDDSYFLPLPFDSDLRRMVWVMNKMLPPDVRILDASPTPDRNILFQDHPRTDDTQQNTEHDNTRPFHPSLDTEAKTYQYTFSLGQFHDPTRCR